MKVAYITAGAAGMYCGSCMHDNSLAKSLQDLGVDVTLIPTYTPLRTDETDVSIDRIFYGGINVYLQQKSALFRHTPWFIDKLFENRRLLNWVSKFSSSTKAEDLGAFTVSVLKGEDGYQRKELLKLVSWLKKDFRPDLVQITNSMFAGFADLLKKELGVPVLCSLQGEDLFLDDLIEPYHEQAMTLLREKSAHIDGFVANSSYYRDFMAEYLAVPREKIHVVPLGLNLAGHGVAQKPAASDDMGENPFVIGYLARLCPEKGLHILVDAFRHLAEDVGAEKVNLRVAGYLSPKDQPFVDDIKEQVENWGLGDCVTILGEVGRDEKISFLNGLDVFSVPAPYKEPKGLYLLESMANGVPVVQPNHGAFPELVEDTGGGLIVDSLEPAVLAAGLKELMLDSAFRGELGKRGRASVHGRFSDKNMAENTLAIYRQYVPE